MIFRIFETILVVLVTIFLFILAKDNLWFLPVPISISVLYPLVIFKMGHLHD